MFDREEHREAAQVVSTVLAKHQQIFRDLADPGGHAMDQTLAAIHGFAYAKLFYDLATISENEAVRLALWDCGVLPTASSDLQNLLSDVARLLFVGEPIPRKSVTKGMQIANSSVAEHRIEKELRTSQTANE